MEEVYFYKLLIVAITLTGVLAAIVSAYFDSRMSREARGLKKKVARMTEIEMKMKIEFLTAQHDKKMNLYKETLDVDLLYEAMKISHKIVLIQEKMGIDFGSPGSFFNVDQIQNEGKM